MTLILFSYTRDVLLLSCCSAKLCGQLLPDMRVKPALDKDINTSSFCEVQHPSDDSSAFHVSPLYDLQQGK